MLEDMGAMLEIMGANVFKVRAFSNAAREIEALTGNLEDMVATGELHDVPGVGKSIFSHIEEMLERGTFKEHEELAAKLPTGLLEMMRIPGVGPKKVKAIHDTLGVASIDDLEKAAQDGQIAELEGFGEKSQEKILRGIESYRRYSQRHLFSEAFAEGKKLLEQVTSHPDVQRSMLGGSLRRRRETIKDIDILVSAKKPGAIMDRFTTLPAVDSVVAKGETKASVVLESGINADLRVVSDKEFPFAAHYFTGSKAHNTELRARAKKMGYKLNEYGLFKDDTPTPCRDEPALFKKLGIDYIEPELREGLGEIDAAEHHTLPQLVKEDSLRGLFHVHTTYSDGHGTVEDMASGATALGFEYLGITDHSKSAAYAGGLSEEKVREQSKEVAALNASMKDLRIFHGIESDILADGSLDYDDETLAVFDFVVVSVHSNFGLSESAMTKRIVRAIENPFTTMLGHPTGRLLLSREGYKLNLTAVIEAAAANDVMIEINSHPVRLDLDWRYLRKAREMGVKIAIGPDAHNVKGMEAFRYCVGISRKGWLTAADVVTTFSADDVAALFEAKKARR
jgi:DNA polymerase (family 10)